MAPQIEVISDGDGLVVIGDRSAVDRYLDHAGLSSHAEEFRLGRAQHCPQISSGSRKDNLRHCRAVGAIPEADARVRETS